MTLDGSWTEIMFQLAAINKPLVSVSKLIETGYRVIFVQLLHLAQTEANQIIKMRK